MKIILAFAAIVILFSIQHVNAETASNDNITISMDVPEYVPQNENFSVNLSVVNISIKPVVAGYLYLETVLLYKPMIYFYKSNNWNKTVELSFPGEGVGGIEWYLPSDINYSAGQTIPIKFRAEEVTHNLSFEVVYWPIGEGHGSSVIIVGTNVTSVPAFDSSAHVTVSNGSTTVFEATYGKGVDYIRYSEGNQQYIVNWDTSGNPPGEYYVRAAFSNGYVSETKVMLY